MTMASRPHAGLTALAAALLALSLLSGCGGGSSDPEQSASAASSELAEGHMRALAVAQQPSYAVVSLTKVSETRVGRTTYDYVFRLSIANTGPERSNVEAKLTSVGPGTTVVDGVVAVGAMAAGATVTPADTITVRHDRSVAFNAAKLAWAISGNSALTFTPTGAAQSWTVPAGVTQIAVDARGGAGANGAVFGGSAGTGGAGAKVTTNLTVTPGQVLQLMVGGAGNGNTGGFNGGGAGGSSARASAVGGGGGGASDVRTGACAVSLSCALADRVIVAGGGGGGASFATAGKGGAGGTVGADGQAADATSGTGGTGGTATAGGAGGGRANGGSVAGAAGALGIGGAGGYASCGCGGGGGGGGGRFGGGGSGWQGGGGGGSSLAPAGATITDGANTGAGTITVRFVSPTETVPLRP